jgi:hypothetical protein
MKVFLNALYRYLVLRFARIIFLLSKRQSIMEHFISDLKASASAENRAFFPHAGNNNFIYPEKPKEDFWEATERC